MRVIVMSDFRSTSTSGLPLSRKTPFNLPVETKKKKKKGWRGQLWTEDDETHIYGDSLLTDYVTRIYPESCNFWVKIPNFNRLSNCLKMSKVSSKSKGGIYGRWSNSKSTCIRGEIIIVESYHCLQKIATIFSWSFLHIRIPSSRSREDSRICKS